MEAPDMLRRPLTKTAILARHRAATVEVGALTQSCGQSWHTSIPVREGDSDELLAASLDDVPRMLDIIGSEGVIRIGVERVRQETREGYDATHDDRHANEELALSAACYALPPEMRRFRIVRGQTVPNLWPFTCDWKPCERIRELEKAGALIAAEIDRLTRLAHRHAAELVGGGARG